MPKFKITFLGIFITILFTISGSPIFAQAPAATPFCSDRVFGCFEVGLPGNSALAPGKPISNFLSEPDRKPIVRFINTAVTATIAILVIIGLISTVIGGYIYMTAGGDASRVKTAKEMIIAALLGIFLSLISVIILNTINVYIGSKAEEPTLSPSPGASKSNSSSNNPSGIDRTKADLRAEQIGLALQIEDLQSKLDDPFLSDSQIADYASQIRAKQARFNEIANLLK